MYTFLVRLARAENASGEQRARVAILTGEIKWRSQIAYLFIKGAVMAENMDAAPDHIDFSKEQWKQIQDDQKQIFLTMTGNCMGGFLTAPDYTGSDRIDDKSTYEIFWRGKGSDADGASGERRCILPL